MVVSAENNSSLMNQKEKLINAKEMFNYYIL